MSIFSFFPKKRANPLDVLEVRFHKDANPFGEHGTIVASHVRQNLNNYPVRFVFLGMVKPPPLTLELHQWLYEEAKAQGYMPTEIRTYGTDNDVVDTTKQILNAKVGSHDWMERTIKGFESPLSEQPKGALMPPIPTPEKADA